jgi:hypothetical protein
VGTLSLAAQADTILDTPVQSGLITQLNALLAPLLSDSFLGVAFKARNQQSTGLDFHAAMTYLTGSSTTMANPYMVQMFTGRTILEVTTNAQVFFTANPGYFYSPLFIQQFGDISRRNMPWIGLVVYNIVYSDGQANWGAHSGGGGGSPTGPAGGDLSGTYPNPLVGPRTSGTTTVASIPASATTLDSAPVASVSDVTWEIELIKGSTRYSTTLRVNLNDGTTPVWQEYGVVIGPPTGGTFDCPLTVTIAGGNINLVCTPGTTGWGARLRSQVFPL